MTSQPFGDMPRVGRLGHLVVPGAHMSNCLAIFHRSCTVLPPKSVQRLQFLHTLSSTPALQPSRVCACVHSCPHSAHAWSLTAALFKTARKCKQATGPLGVVDKPHVVHTYNGALFSLGKKGNSAHVHRAQWNKPITKEH
jgi:hypothetical protein